MYDNYTEGMTPPHYPAVWRQIDSVENEKHPINWSIITIPNILQLCRQQVGKDKSWHPHLSNEDLLHYLEEVPLTEYWWCLPTLLLADLAADGAS